jgi:hypothetical protein
MRQKVNLGQSVGEIRIKGNVEGAAHSVKQDRICVECIHAYKSKSELLICCKDRSPVTRATKGLENVSGI